MNGSDLMWSLTCCPLYWILVSKPPPTEPSLLQADRPWCTNTLSVNICTVHPGEVDLVSEASRCRCNLAQPCKMIRRSRARLSRSDCVLLVGEGGFSFAAAVTTLLQALPSNIVSTSNSAPCIDIHISRLRRDGFDCRTSIDATQLTFDVSRRWTGRHDMSRYLST